MGAPLRTTTSDIPDFSTYPAAPSDHLLSAQGPEGSNARLNDVATEVGRRIGEAAAVVGGLRERATARVQTLRDSVNELAGSVRERSADAAQEQFDRLRAESRVRIDQARRYAEANPLMIIAAAGVVGLILGAGARAWRENRG